MTHTAYLDSGGAVRLTVDGNILQRQVNFVNINFIQMFKTPDISRFLLCGSFFVLSGSDEIGGIVEDSILTIRIKIREERKEIKFEGGEGGRSLHDGWGCCVR